MRLQTETQSDIHFTLRYVPIEDMVGASLGPAQPGPSQDVGEGTVRISALASAVSALGIGAAGVFALASAPARW